MGQYLNPLDFKKIFLEYFLGSLQLFMFAFIICISFICAKFGMSNRVFLVILVITSLLFGAYLGQAVYILIIFLVGYISFRSIGGLVR
jgi:hypothetical protein